MNFIQSISEEDEQCSRKKKRDFVHVLLIKFLVVFFVFFVFFYTSAGAGAEIAYCDEGQNSFLHPSVPLPENSATPPEASLVPQPVEIPQLAQPLVSDATRDGLLYCRSLLLNFGRMNGDLRHMVSVIEAQIIVERSVEVALVYDGFRPHSILDRYTEIRGILHSPHGALLSERTYHSYVTQIRENGTRQSTPYLRIMRAILNNGLLLDRRM